MIRLLFAACGVALVAAQPLDITRFPDDPARKLVATARVEPDAIRLSGEVRLTLTVEGPGPLEVTPGKPLLTNALTWRVREDGLPLREKQATGREQWTQVYRLSPLVPGDPKIALSALTVRTSDGDLVLKWDGELGVRVTTTITLPSAETARPATDIEALPVPPVPPSSARPWLFSIVPALLVIAAIAIVVVRRKREVRVPRDAAWALRELSSGEASADRYATVLRQYLAFQHGIPTDATTTPELTTRLRATPTFPQETVPEWQGLFEAFDVARFSGTSAEIQGLADRATALVTSQQASRAP
jgi:hypothetical protein